jgi:hypothetical protein
MWADITANMLQLDCGLEGCLSFGIWFTQQLNSKIIQQNKSNIITHKYATGSTFYYPKVS